MNNLINIFVYGTLRSLSWPDNSPFYPEIAPYVIGTTLAWVKGALLYDHGAYPYVCPSAGTVTALLLMSVSYSQIANDRAKMKISWGAG
jgi:gamma-glutamylcyclotransferase (GGCT)/AIG2-like uncharacterized protein YtfP